MQGATASLGRSGTGREPDGRRQMLLIVLLLLLITGTLTVCAALVFPQDDDGYLMLLLREGGLQAVIAGHPDRPLVARLWVFLARSFADRFWPFAYGAHLIIWSAFGLESALLWRRLFPEWRQYAVLPAVLTICPVVVRTQLSVVTVTLLGLTSAALAYGGLLMLLRFSTRGGWPRVFGGLAAIASGVCFSDYGVASAAPAVVLLASESLLTESREEGSRSRWAAFATAVTVVLSYGVYQLTRDTTLHPDVDPRLAAAQPILSYPLGLLTRVWWVVAGAYGEAVARLWFDWFSKSSLLALAYGCGIGWLLIASTGKNPRGEAPEGRRIWILLLALVAGLFPVVMMRHTSATQYMTRFYIPVMPIAAALTSYVLLLAVRHRYRLVAIFLLGLAVGASVVTESSQAYRRHRLLSRIGSALREPVAKGPFNTVAVLSTGEFGTGFLHPTVVAAWPADLSRRLWVYDAVTALDRIGPRSRCPANVSLHDEFRDVIRDGRIGQIVWVEILGDQFRIEPYCFHP